MKIDYVVFEPDNERLAQIIVRFLQERGYTAGYQLGYPKNKIFIRVDTKEDANRISRTIRRFIEDFKLTGSEITLEELKKSINIPKSVLTEAENATNLAAQPEFESEEPEPEELEPMPELEIEQEEPEPKLMPDFEPEPEPEEPETAMIPELESEPASEEPETKSMPELEIEQEEPEPKLMPDFEPEPEPEEPETEPILEIEPEPEKPEPEPMPEFEPDAEEPEKHEPKQKPDTKSKSQSQFFL